MRIARIIVAAFSAAIVVAAVILSPAASAQRKKPSSRSTAARPEPTKPVVVQPTPTPEVKPVKVKTPPVMVPVFATNAAGQSTKDLRLEELVLYENDVKQNIVLVASDAVPLSVVLLLDTSNSTQDNLGQMRRAATAFVDQLQPADRIKVVTFDDQVRELNDFSADRAVVKTAIQKVSPGYSTKFYDGVSVALEALREIEGRKALVIFSDGVDYRSEYSSAEGTLRSLDEDGVAVYSIRYSTRVAAERLARQQTGGDLPTREVVRTNSPTPETRPGELPGERPQRRTGPMGLPLPGGGGRPDDRDQDRFPAPDRPPAGEVGVDLPSGRPDPRVSSKTREKKKTEDPVGSALDKLYTTADGYLQALVEKSGGQLLRADDITGLPVALSQIAAELRSQYWLGYSPTNSVRDDQYRAIKVTSTRPGLILRTRAGYRAKR